MTDPNDEPQKPSINADHNSNAVGSISAGGDISGNIHIGNVYQTPEDDISLSSDEIENGLTRFAQYLPERAPVLQDSFSSIAKKLRATLGADQNSLSPALKSQREDGVARMKLMCMEVTDISFRAMCLGQNPPPYDSRPPFLGLFAFRPEDKEFFFGRDALVQKLVASIKAYPFLAVLGNSGSGKSSLVMAGLVPALEAQMSYLTPSSVPLYQLLAAKESASAKTVFVIDQFEELFTHPHDAAERADFIHALLELTKTNRVVITMRADFWGEVAIYSDLKQAMQEHQELIAPMTVDELHSAMEKQAAVVGLRFEPTLSDSILAEVKGEPGAMPLLQHALWELWNRRHGLWIKAEEYQAFGGVKQAIASTAEEVYASCSDFEGTRVRDIFLRLTRLDESGEGRDTRRRVLIEELIPVSSDSSITINLLDKLADARLIVKTDKDVEVAHEALIRHWSRLTEWLNEDRDNLRLREGVSESAREWENSKRDESLLNHRGGRLELALAMSKLPRYQLNPIEQAYLNGCMALRNKEQRERERRLRYTVIASITAAIIFLMLGSFGLVKSNEATAQAGTAQANSDIALARQLAAQAQTLFAIGDSKQETAVLLAIQSMRIFPAGEAAQTLQSNTLVRPITHMIHTGSVNSVVFSPDGKYVVSGACDNPDCTQGSARVWESATGKEVSRIKHNGAVYSVAFSPDGKYVVSGGGYTVCVWEAVTGKEISRMTHDGPINSAAFSPDGKYVVSGSNDNTARVWEAATGKEISRMTHDGPVNSVAFSPDGKYVVSGSYDKTARVWEAATGQEIARMTHDFIVNNVAFNLDGKYVVSESSDHTARIWEAVTGQEISRMKFGALDSVYSMAFSPDGKYIVTGSGIFHIETAIVWDINTGREITRMTHDGSLGYLQGAGGADNRPQISSVAFSPDGKLVVSGGCDKLGTGGNCAAGSARVWNATTGKEIARMDYDGAVNSAAFSPDGKYIVSGSENGFAHVWQPGKENGSVRMTYQSKVYSVAFSPDSRFVVSGGGDGDPTARVWDVVTGQEIARMKHDIWVNFVAFSPDGKYVISGQETARVWEAGTGLQIFSIKHGASTSSAAFSPDGKYVVAAGCDRLDANFACVQGSAQVWEISTAKEVVHMMHTGALYSVAFSPDGKFIISGGCDKYDSAADCVKGSAHVWEAATGREIIHITHDGPVSSVAFSPDGKYVVSAGDSAARVWEAATGKEIARMTHDGLIDSAAFSPDGKYVVSAGDITARVWEAATGKEIARMTHDGTVKAVAFSPDSKYVVSAGDITARVWEAATGKEIARMTHDGPVYSVAFSPNGRYVVSGSDDNTARVWMYRPEDLIADACSHATHNLTYIEWQRYIGNALPYQAVCPNLPLDLEYFKAIAKDVLSNAKDPNRVKAAIDQVKAALIIDATVKDLSAETLDIVNAATVEQISMEVAAGNMEKALDLFKQAGEMQIQISVEDKNTLYAAIARADLSKDDDPNRVQTALDQVKAVLMIDGDVKDPTAESFSIVSAAAAKQISSEANPANIEKALDLFEQAKQIQMQIPIDDSITLNALCWEGSLRGYEKQVLQYCETAVNLTPDDASIRDSRGLARALTGDYQGAILDFQYFADNSTDSTLIEQRRQWIEQLKKGINPFTPDVLETLKSR